MIDERRIDIISRINSGEIESLADYIEYDTKDDPKVPPGYIKHFEIPDGIFFGISNDRKFLGRLHQFKQLIAFLVSRGLLIENSIGEKRKFFFLSNEKMVDFSPRSSQNVGLYVVEEIQKYYEANKDARYIATDELGTYIANGHKTPEEIEEERRDKYFRRSERLTRIFAFVSIILSAASVFTGIWSVYTYTTVREVKLSDYKALPVPLEVRILPSEQSQEPQTKPAVKK